MAPTMRKESVGARSSSTPVKRGDNRVINNVASAIGNIASGIFNEARGRSGGYTPQPRSATQPKASSRPKPQTSVSDIAQAVVNTGRGIYGEATGKGKGSTGRVPGRQQTPRKNPVIFGQELPALGPNQHRSTINPQYAALLKAAGYSPPANNGVALPNMVSGKPGINNPAPTGPVYDGTGSGNQPPIWGGSQPDNLPGPGDLDPGMSGGGLSDESTGYIHPGDPYLTMPIANASPGKDSMGYNQSYISPDGVVHIGGDWPHDIAPSDPFYPWQLRIRFGF